MPELISVVVVDDDADFGRIISDDLTEDASFRVLPMLGSGKEALAVLPELKPDVVLMDINMEEGSGIEAVRGLKPLLPQAKIIMLTVFEDTDSIFAALSAGADGYLLKHVAGDRLVSSIHDVVTGGAPMSAAIARRVVTSFRKEEADDSGKPQLSPRELQVLEALTEGLAYKKIADELGLSYSTVRTYIERIYQKLHVHTRTDAVVKFLRV